MRIYGVYIIMEFIVLWNDLLGELNNSKMRLHLMLCSEKE